MLRFLGISFLLFVAKIIFAQTSVGINVQGDPNEFAVLELVSPTNNQGLLVPRLTTEQRTNSIFIKQLTPRENGLLVFDSNLKKLYYWEDTLWVKVGAGEFPQLEEVLNENNSANFFRIIDLAKPVNENDATNKFYVDSVLSTVTLDLTDVISRIDLIEKEIISINDSLAKFSNYFIQVFDSLAIHRIEIEVLKDSIYVFSSRIDTLEVRVKEFDTVIKEISTSGLNQVLKYNNDAGSIKITNLGDPETATDAVTKKYVDDSIQVLRNDIVANKTEIENLDKRVTDIDTAITNIDKRVTKNEENITQNIFYLDSILNKGGTLPQQSGNAGKYLRTDGTDAEWNLLATVAETGNMSDLTNDAGYVTQSSLTTNAVTRWNGELTNGTIWDDGNGHVLIGSTVDSIDAGYNLEVAGVFRTSKIYHSSDARYKKDIEPIDSALTKVLKINGVTYKWRTEEFDNMNFPEGVQIGLIAQDIEKIFPELVMTDKSGFKSVEYANVVAILIEAMKQQQQIIEAQSNKIDKLEQDNIRTQARLENIEKIMQMLPFETETAAVKSE